MILSVKCIKGHALKHDNKHMSSKLGTTDFSAQMSSAMKKGLATKLKWIQKYLFKTHRRVGKELFLGSISLTNCSRMIQINVGHIDLNHPSFQVHPPETPCFFPEATEIISLSLTYLGKYTCIWDIRIHLIQSLIDKIWR